jgi:hypothetical protein
VSAPTAAGAGMRPAVLFRLARAGSRTDTLRAVLTALSAALATLALLAAVTVLAIGHPMLGGHKALYTSELLRDAGLRPGVAFTLLLLTIPVLALAGQCARLGGPARDRRLAAVRLAGGTPRQAISLAVAETGTAALLGALVGLGGYFAARAALDAPLGPFHVRPLPTDVLPPVVVLALIVLAVPVLASLAAALLLRDVVTTPLGVSRRARRRRAPRPWPVLLVLTGVVAFAASVAMVHAQSAAHVVISLALVGSVLLVAIGLVLSTRWAAQAAGGLLHRFGRGPAALLAARRLTADPWQGSRVHAALLTAALVAGGSAAFRSLFETREVAYRAASHAFATAAGRRDVYTPDRFYLDAMDQVDAAVIVALVIAALGVLVALAEAVSSRRRAHAALLAAGTPRAVLGRSVLWQVLAPLVPMLLLALAIGTALGRVFGTEVRVPGPDIGVDGSRVDVGDVVRVVHVPWGELALYGAGMLALVLAAVGVSVLLLRRGTSIGELRAG